MIFCFVVDLSEGSFGFEDGFVFDGGGGVVVISGG